MLLLRAEAGDDCEVGTSGRKACKNCSCGRAEAEALGEKAKLTPEMLENPVSACGNVSPGACVACSASCLSSPGPSHCCVERLCAFPTPNTLLVPLHSMQCSLGDAFRCAGCPYKGLPAFEAGKKIQLPRDMLVADV